MLLLQPYIVAVLVTICKQKVQQQSGVSTAVAGCNYADCTLSALGYACKNMIVN